MFVIKSRFGFYVKIDRWLGDTIVASIDQATQFTHRSIALQFASADDEIVEVI